MWCSEQKPSQVFLWLVLFFLPFMTAHAVSSFCQDNRWSPYVGFGAGVNVVSNLGASKDFPPDDSFSMEFFNYMGYQPQSAALFNGFVGAECFVSPKWLLQLGMDYNQSSKLTATGVLTQGIDDISADSYVYNYHVLMKQVLVQGKLLYHYSDRYYPYLMLGLGAAMNAASEYQTDVPPFVTFTPMYSNASQSGFSYSIGIGIDTVIATKLRLSVGYRFSDFGRMRLGDALIDSIPVSMRLSQSHLYVNQVLAQWILII